MTPCFALEASDPSISDCSIEEKLELGGKEQQGTVSDAENSEGIAHQDPSHLQSSQFLEEYWDDDDGDSSYASENDNCYPFHEWYLPEAYCQSYEIPVLFEDGMDLVECELYYAAREQGSGGYTFRKNSSKGSSHRNRQTTPTSVASHALFQRGGGALSRDGKHPLSSCLRQASRRFASTLSPPLDVPACQPQRVDEELSSWLDGSPGLRRCSYAGVITKTRKTLPIGSPKPKRHHHGKDWFVNKNLSETPFIRSDMNSPEREGSQDPEDSLTAATSSSHSRDSTSSIHSSATMPPVLPKRRASLLELHHRKSKSHSELMDMVEPYVSFAPAVQVITIPAAYEYPDDIRRDLWNTRRELKRFLRLAKSEKRHRQETSELSDDEEAEGIENVTSHRTRTRRNGKRHDKTAGNKEEQGNNELDESKAAEDDDLFYTDNDLQCAEDILDRLDHV